MLSKQFEPSKIESKWYNHWLSHNYFNSKPDQRKPYTIVIPPPNVTGVLHMGHMLNNTLQDVMIRRARMKGFNTCWVPGTDHASIATEAKVLKNLSEQGIKKEDLSRSEFMEHAYAWKDKHGGVILEQLKKLGASCDWPRTKFTMDQDMNESVIKVFVDLYNKGLIYRGVRMVNWDPSAQTAVSDEEVVHKEIKSKLYHISYDLEDSDEKITIATTRPETILGDTAICVNPKDSRYKHLKNKKAIVPLINRSIPVIFDDYVDMEFGTGALKITPAHDLNDYEIGDRHNLETIDILNNDGTLSEEAILYVGEDRFDVRKKIEQDLKEKGCLIKLEEYTNKVGFSERTDAVIEPKLSMQWFCKMEEISKPALDNVISDNIKIHPAKFKNTYRHWMENIKDWCVSRQLWWGQRIPAYFYEGNKFVVANNIDLALELVQKENPELTKYDLRQDEDVLDTWFSSWLWPISVFDGIRNPENQEIKYYYPTNDLITGPDILFFWVARMIISGYEYRGEPPFKDVYLTGLVRDKKGRKMSKSLGNSPDPINLIEKYGADGVRVGMLLCAPAGNDLPFDESLCEQGRNFSNKIWNAMRLVKGWDVNDKIESSSSSKIALEWFENRLSKFLEDFDNSFNRYRLSEALMSVYRLFWDDFCSVFLEMIKPKDSNIDKLTYNKILDFFDILLKSLHPFMPFVTEEVWSLLKEREKDLIVSDWPVYGNCDNLILSKMETCKKIISETRNILSSKNLSHNKVTFLYSQENDFDEEYFSLISKLTKIEKIDSLKEISPEYFLINVDKNQFYIKSELSINKEEELVKIQKELDYLKGFLKSVENKLNNSNFINNAPANVVEIENKKRIDTLDKIKIIKNQLDKIEGV